VPALLAFALAVVVVFGTLTSPRSSRAAPSGRSLPGASEAAEPNPYLSIPLPGSRPDYARWRSEEQAALAARLAAAPEAFAQVAPLEFVEQEVGRGLNDTPSRAEPLAGFAALQGTPSVRVRGFLDPALPPARMPAPEDDGDLRRATDLGLEAGQSVRVAGRVGDGPHGSAGTGKGDFDFFVVRNVATRQSLNVYAAAGPDSPLDPALTIYDAEGNFVAGDSIFEPSVDRALFTVPRAGDYYIAITAFPDMSLDDAWDSSTGHGAADEGSYVLTVELGDVPRDTDVYSFDLQPGDILGARVLGAPRETAVRILLPNGDEAVSSAGDLSFVYPNSTPLPLGGVANAAHVASVGGRYAVAVSQLAGSLGGSYTLEIQAFRPPLDGMQRKQKIFVDFDGATVNAGAFVPGLGIVTLSPLAAFLPAFGLAASDEDALIDGILGVLHDRLVAEIGSLGLSSDFALEIRNSRDHEDTFGREPDVSRLIIGGSIAESGIATIGIAESIDVGNFADRESALVLLDFLADFSSSVPLAPGALRRDMVATGIGNLAAHEAGHMLGNFHTSNASELVNVMDEGGLPESFFELGPDGVFGSTDDVAVQFGADRFSFVEGLSGSEDTLNRIAFALETRRSAPAPPTSLARLQPHTVLAGVNGAEILALGDGFTPLSTAANDSATASPRFESRRLLGIPIDPLRLRLPGVVRVRIDTPGGGSSSVQPLQVLPSLQLIRAGFERNGDGFASDRLGSNAWVRTTNRGDQAGHSRRTSFYFGDPELQSYATQTREAGALVSPPLRLPPGAQLSFTYLLESERVAPFDQAQVQISSDGFATFERLLSNFGEGLRDGTGRFEQATVDLSRFAGRSVQIRFVFDTGDLFNNDFEGWYVDDVVILAPDSRGPLPR